MAASEGPEVLPAWDTSEMLAGAGAAVTPRLEPAVSERIELLDILRGFALLVMLIVHMSNFTNHDHESASNITDLFLANKGLCIFSMLFGMGFAVQMLKMQATKRPFVLLYIRRMIILFLIGAANWCLVLGNGDVLTTYAVYGLMLLLLSRMSSRTAVVLATLFLALNLWRAPLIQTINTALNVPVRRAALLRMNGGVSVAEQLKEAVKTGTYTDVVKLQARQFRNYKTEPALWVTAIVVPSYFFPMFLLGFAAVKNGLVTAIGERRTIVRRLMWSSFVIGILSNPLPYLKPELKMPQWITQISFLLSGPSLGIFYACAIALLLVEGGAASRVLRPLRWPGRMGLTNYIAHYAIVITIYYGFGLGLMNRVSIYQAWALSAVIFASIWTCSYLWLSHFPYGPLEWLWRSLSFGKFPLKASTLPSGETPVSAA